MPQKEGLQEQDQSQLQRQCHDGGSIPPGFSGFVAIYDDGTRVLERENYHSEKLRKKMATNWLEIDRARLASLELYWRGQMMSSIGKADHPDISPPDWFFSHTGCLDVSTHSIRVVARNIGYKDGSGLTNIISVNEVDGTMKGYARA